MKQISILFIAILIFSGQAHADCTVTSVPVSFGQFPSVMSAPEYSVGSITVTCTPPATTLIKLNAGQSGSFSPRRMKSDGGDTLDYNLYTDAACTTIWGDGTDGTFTQTGMGNFTVYGKIPTQTLKPDHYGDSIVITVEW